MVKQQSIKDILCFWFTEPMSKHWFSSSEKIDKEIRDRYESTWNQAKQGKLNHWSDSADGCLALCILLDQFPLNMFRGTAKSFSTEQLAVAISKSSIKAGQDKEIEKERVAFLYMPLMHSEKLQDQDLAVKCFEKAKIEGNLRFAKHHRQIIKDFGRFPHRNQILGRESTHAEIIYLNSDRAFTG